MNIGKKSLSLVLAAALMFGVVTVGGGAAAVVYTDAAEGNYYSSITATQGTQLLGQLHDLIVETHTKYTSYDSYGSYVYKMDPGSKSNSIREFYTHETMTTGLGGNVGQFNREHVWPKSLSNNLWKNDRGGADLHHLRPTEVSLNSTRNNDLYGEVDGGQAAYSKSGALGGYRSDGVFEPLDNVKGDAARIILYMYVHYNTYTNAAFGGYASTNGKGASNCFGNLPITNVISASNADAAFDLLIKWNEEDEPDEVERTRNEYVQSVQGNRNPFIDHPEYASAIWGDGSYVPPVSDITPTALTISPSVVNMSVGGTANLTVTATPSNASTSVKWSVEPKNVVTVVDGKLTAYAEGQATVTATSTLASNVTASVQVTVVKSQGGGDTAGSFTITLDSFDLTEGYGFKTWSAGGVKGTAFIFGGSGEYSSTGMQFNKSKASYYLASTTATSGPIKSVTVKANAATTADREWKLLTSSSAYGEVAGKPTNGNDHGTKSVTTNGTTWEVSGSDTFFALTYELTETKGASYLDSITVEYAASQGETPPTPHQHDFEYEDNSDETHLVACKTCDYLEEEPHVYSNDTDTTCNLCKHVRTVHTHEYQYKPLDDTYHSITCKGCDKVNDREVHVYTDAEDTTCEKCGYVRTLGGGTHEHTLVYEEEDDTYHTVTCTGCDEVNKREEHEYTDDSDTTCNKCGHVRTVVDAQKVAAFHTAVQNIKTSGSLSARGQSIAAALNAYDALSDDEKEAAKSDYQALQAAIEAYNQTVNAYNERAEETNDLFVPKKKAEE